MEMEDSIHMIKVHQRFYQKLSNMMGAGGTDIPRYTHNLDLSRDSILNGFEWRKSTDQEKVVEQEEELEFAEGYLLEDDEVVEGYYEGLGDNLDLICDETDFPEDMGD